MSDSGQADLSTLVERTRQMRHRLESTQRDMAALEATGTGGGGLVTATISGENALVGLEIDPSVINPDDPGALSELVREAVNDAYRRLAAQRGQRVAGLAQGFEGMLAGLRAPEGGVVPMTARRREPPATPAP